MILLLEGDAPSATQPSPAPTRRTPTTRTPHRLNPRPHRTLRFLSTVAAAVEPRTRLVEVSFIIPLFNCLPLTQAMLASLRATLPVDLSHEIIFVDDGSTDGTRDWLRTLSVEPAIRVLLNDRNLGYAAANNRAAALATGQLLVLLNNDLVLTPRWLEPILAAHANIARSPTSDSATPPAAIIGNIQLNVATGAIDHTGIFINAKLKPQHDTTPPYTHRLFPFTNALREVIASTGACLSIPRTLWQQLGGFDEAFVNGCEDIDLCLRARAAGHPTLIALRSVIRHHISSSPGRKLRDEQNTRRLTLRWRDELTRLATHVWCHDFLTRDLTAATAFNAPLDALAIALFSTDITSAPPSAALRGIASALDREFTRWDELLGKHEPGSPAAHHLAHH